MTAVAYRCKACASDVAAEPFTAEEMLLDSHESFDYVECPACGSIQIIQIPVDLARYYPDSYRHQVSRASAVGRFLRRQRGAYVRGARWNLLGAAALTVSRPAWVDWMRSTKARTESRILDVGFGDGALLGTLSAAGYTSLTGIDPFAAPILGVKNVVTHRRTIDDEVGSYDVVMLHHSLEHVPDPNETLLHVRRVLAPGGRLLVRIPVAGSYGWRTYREHWLGLEPPRHLLIPSIEGMRKLAERSGFAIESTAFDSSGCCYAVSEIWASGRSVPYPRRPWQNRTLELCGAERVEQLERLSRERNGAGDGDHAAFYLRAME